MTDRFSDRGRLWAFPSCFLIVLLSAGILGAGGAVGGDGFDARQELRRADVLIDEGKLDEAIAVLVEVARRDPEQIARVQSVILEIRGIKSQVNDLFEELNEAILTGDEDAADEKIRSVKAIDTSPNRNTLNNLILAAIVVGKARNDAIRDGFFDEGNALLESGDYPGAVLAYRQGFVNDSYLEFYDDYVVLAEQQAAITRYSDDPGRQEQIWEAYGNVAPEGDIVMVSLDEFLDVWQEDAEALLTAADSASLTVSSQAAGAWEDSLNALRDALLRTDSSAADGAGATDELEALRVRMYAILDDIPEDFRYERIVQFMRGRGSRQGEEGILIAQTALREGSLTQVFTDMNRRMESLITDAREAYLAGDWETAGSGFAQASLAAQAAGNFSASASTDESVGDNPAFRRAVVEASALWRELAEITRVQLDPANVNYSDASLEDIDGLADTVQAAVEGAAALLGRWNGVEARLAQLEGAATDETSLVGSWLRTDLNRAVGAWSERRIALYVNAVTPLYEVLQADVARTTAASVDELRGLFDADAAGRRPSYAVDSVLTPAVEAVGVVEDDIGSFLDVVNRMLQRRPPIGDPQKLAAFDSRGSALLSDSAAYRRSLEGLIDEALTLAAEARRAETGAQNALATAERDLAAARAAVERGRDEDDIDEFYRSIDLYDSVDGALDEVDRFFQDVLNRDADIAAESGLEAARTELRNRVRSDRSRVAVTVKQNAVEEGRAAYDDGLYTAGLAILNQSQEFWNRAYDEDDPELAAWIVRLRNAQQALSQTVIEPGDPLFTEMNQYLNLAGRYFAEGERLASSANRNSDALQAFRAAEDLVRQVLSTFPGNEAALLLEQLIVRQTDRDAWAADARDLVTQGRRAVSTDNTDAMRGNDSRKGLYAQLTVLREIEANFPGLEALIYDVEVALGIIIPPPDPRIRLESERLTGEARRVWDNLGAAGSDRAVELLDEAIALWLENDAASTLKNEILLSSEPERLPPLPLELLNLLTFVEDYYVQENFILAGAFMDRIDADYPGFASEPRVREWRRKVDARR